MTALRDRVHAGGFIISEQGSVSRDAGFLAVGEKHDAGTLLEENGDGDLVAWTAIANPVRGILFAGADATDLRTQVTIVARFAVVALDSLNYPEGKSASARDALALQRILVLADHAIADTGGGGGGDAYLATGVQVSTGTKLENSSLAATGDDTGYLSYVYWFKMSAADFGNNGVMWVQDPENFYPSNSYFSDGGGSGAGFIHHQVCASQDENCLSATIGAGLDDTGGHTQVPLETWTPLLVNFQINKSPTSAMIAQAYLGDTLVMYALGLEPGTNNSLAPFLMTWNGLSLHFFDDGNPPMVSGGFADIWFAPGQLVDWSIEANRRKIFDASGKPVYLGANGELVTGTAPAAFFSKNNMDAVPFETNRGTGGSFTLTGSLPDATTSPSD